MVPSPCPHCGQWRDEKWFEFRMELQRARLRKAAVDAKARGDNVGRLRQYDHKEIRRLRGRGLSIRRIAKEIGCSPWTVFRVVRDEK